MRPARADRSIAREALDASVTGRASRLLLALTVTAALGVLASAQADTGAPRGPAALDPVADPAAVIIRGSARFTVLSDAVMRLEYSPTGVFEDRASTRFRNRRMPVPWFQVVSREGFTHVRASDLLIRFREPDGRFTRLDLTARVVSDGAGFWWTPDVRDERSLGGPLSRSGWALVDDSATPLLPDAKDANPPQRVPGALDWYIFSHGDDHARALRDFTALTGRPPLPPFEAIRSTGPTTPRAEATDPNDRTIPSVPTVSLGSSWSDLPACVASIAQSGNVAAPLVLVALGDEPVADGVLLRRQAQAAALAPLLARNPAFGRFSEVAALRRELAPTTYSAARRAHDEGLPIWRPMYIRWRYLDEAYARPAQFMLSDDLLVAPVCDPPQAISGGSLTRVWLAEGGWINRRTGERRTGPAEVRGLAQPDELPIWVREGAIIAAHADSDHTAESTQHDRHASPRLVLHVYGGDSGETRIYEDDGRTQAYRNGRFAWTRISHERSGSRRVLTIDPAEGDVGGLPAHRELELRLHNSPPFQSVLLNGTPVQHGRSADSGGWWFDADALCPVIRVGAQRRREPMRVEAVTMEFAELQRAMDAGLRGRLAILDDAAREIGNTGPTLRQALLLREALARFDTESPAGRPVGSNTQQAEPVPANSARDVAAVRAALEAAESPDLVREILRAPLPDGRRIKLISRLAGVGFSVQGVPTGSAEPHHASADQQRVLVTLFHHPIRPDANPLRIEARVRLRVPGLADGESSDWTPLEPSNAAIPATAASVILSKPGAPDRTDQPGANPVVVECEVTIRDDHTRLTAVESVTIEPPVSPPALHGPHRP